ncbi:uncharacterized protein [Euwallacea similis]|uniref:uncharacterized protein n=1 Tax=Euwallacea similis TaxID=1736056 RepID=UPI00344EAAC3
MYLFLSTFCVLLYVLDYLFSTKLKQMASPELMKVSSPLHPINKESYEAYSTHTQFRTFERGFTVPSENKNLYFKSESYLTAVDPSENIKVKGPMASQKLILYMKKFRKIVNQINCLMCLSDFKKEEGKPHSGYLEMDRILAIMTLKWLKHREELDKRYEPKCFKYFYNDPPKTNNRVHILHIKWTVKFMALGRRFFSFIECDNGVTVYGTNVDYIGRKIELNFWGPYKFENLPEKFRITARIYTWDPDVTPSIRAVGDIIIDDRVLKGKNLQIKASSSNVLREYFELLGLTVTLQHNGREPVTYQTLACDP